MREGRHMDKKIKKAIAEVVQILFGTGLFGLAVNQLILPFGLYNTGFLGIAQVIVSILTDVTRIYRGSFDLVSPIFLMINIPAFLLGLFLMGKKFMVKTIFATIMYSVWMMILPAPEPCNCIRSVDSMFAGWYSDRNRSGHCVDNRSCRRRTGYRGNVYYRAQSQGVCWHHVHYY